MRPLLPLNQSEALLRRALETAEETIRKLYLENEKLKRELKGYFDKYPELSYQRKEEFGVVV